MKTPRIVWLVCLAGALFADAAHAAVDQLMINGAPALVTAPGGSASAIAAYPPIGNPTISGVTIGTSSAKALAAPPPPALRSYLLIENESASASIACSFGGTAAINSAGSFLLGPGVQRVWLPGTAPQGDVNCIASGAATPATFSVY